MRGADADTARWEAAASEYPDEEHVLVVGATRVLKPAVAALAGRGARVTAVARDAAALAELAAEGAALVRPLAADAGGPVFARAVRRAAGARGFSGALVYTPAWPARSAAGQLPGLLRGPGVLLLPSSWAAPDVPARPGPASASRPWDPGLLPDEAGTGQWCRRLVLGWHPAGAHTRWHTPDEISAAALGLLDAPLRADAVLGEVRPWTARPV